MTAIAPTVFFDTKQLRDDLRAQIMRALDNAIRPEALPDDKLVEMNDIIGNAPQFIMTLEIGMSKDGQSISRICVTGWRDGINTDVSSVLCLMPEAN
jgi:hypothetical protein